MKHLRYEIHIIVILCTLAGLTGCTSYTRTEKDVYTLTHKDTVTKSQVSNQPGDRDNGIIYPSSRTVIAERNMIQTDSIVTREYPNFIRLGLFEGIGLIGTNQGGGSTQTGLFGLFYDLDRLLNGAPVEETETAVFNGYIYRVGIGEWKLHWPGGEKNWTFGVTAYEVIKPDNSSNHTLTGIGVPTIHKRFYISDRIPYLAVVPQMSFALFPSPYLNPAVAAELGSIGGLNLRLYAGYAIGMTSWVNGNSVNFPYFGVGASVFDFLNQEEEMEVEWKNHEHSAWQIDVGDVMVVSSGTEFSMFTSTDPTKPQPILSGVAGRIGNAEIALPLLDRRLALGTTLINVVILGAAEYGFAAFPLRLSYFWNPFGSKFTIQPFAEYNIAPSTFFHTGVRAMLPLGDNTSLHIVAAYANGNTGSTAGWSVGNTNQSGFNNTFSAFYVGFGASFFEALFGRNDLRYGRGLPHE